MLRTRFAIACAALVVAAAPLAAQQAPATLTLEEAVSLARRHSPTFRAQANDEAVADWAVRSAYGALLPTFSVRGGLSWEAGGTPRIGNLSGDELGISRTPDRAYSDYNMGVNMQLSGATFFRMAQERANREATRARIGAAGFMLESDVARLYLTALRARDNVILSRRVLETAEEALRLAQARFDAGAATRLDVSQAEVARGRAQVALLQAQAAEETEKLRLLQRIGLDLDRGVELTTQLDVFEPQWSQEELTEIALRSHPQLQSARAAESAGRAAARSARMSYLPTLSLSAGRSGYTATTLDRNYLIAQAHQTAQSRTESCEATNDLFARLADPLPPQNCARFAVTPQDEANIIARNEMWPFNFTKQSPGASLSLSLPIFNGFTREYQMQQASAAAEDARYNRREEELNRRTAVATSYLAVRTAFLAVGIEESNVLAANEQLELAQERYRLGAGSILELTQAQETKARADQAHLQALYAFHENLSALEAAVGRSLR